MSVVSCLLALGKNANLGYKDNIKSLKISVKNTKKQIVWLRLQMLFITKGCIPVN